MFQLVPSSNNGITKLYGYLVIFVIHPSVVILITLKLSLILSIVWLFTPSPPTYYPQSHIKNHALIHVSDMDNYFHPYDQINQSQKSLPTFEEGETMRWWYNKLAAARRTTYTTSQHHHLTHHIKAEPFFPWNLGRKKSEQPNFSQFGITRIACITLTYSNKYLLIRAIEWNKESRISRFHVEILYIFGNRHSDLMHALWKHLLVCQSTCIFLKLATCAYWRDDKYCFRNTYLRSGGLRCTSI